MEPVNPILEIRVKIFNTSPATLRTSEKPTIGPTLDFDPSMHQAPDPQASRDAAAGGVANGQTVPAVTGFAFEPAVQCRHDKRLGVVPRFDPEIPQALQ